LFFFPVHAAAQSATAGAVLGTVMDPQQAAVIGAKVTIQNLNVNLTLETSTGSNGQYAFPSVIPGTYKVTAATKGFRTTSIPNFVVEVAKGYTLDIKMELGEVSETVEVAAGAQVELQTTDATIGIVLPTTEIERFPALTRQVNELLTLQPGATPTGEITGARNDQSSFMLDGIDVTNNSVGGLGTFAFLPIDSIEEFRVSVANPNADFGRGAGGQVSLLSRSGTDQYHGSAYWFHQNDNLNANSWDFGHTPVRNSDGSIKSTFTPKAELKDNRFGGRVGGPLPFPWHKKTYFFANYEGRRFPGSTPQSRIVPTDSLKQGILKFRDASGAVVSYNLATASLCGAAGTGACDPRGLGLSPSVSALWALLPPGNDPTVSGIDGLNTTGYTTTAGTPLGNDFYDLRFDQDLTSKWHADVSYRYFRQAQISALQLDIINGSPSTTRSLPIRQNMLVAGLHGQLTSNLTSSLRFGWVRERDATNPERPNAVAAQEKIPGTDTSAGPIALDIGASGGTHSLLDEPIDVGTQVARKQANDDRNFQWNADFVWVRGRHTFEFGTAIHYLPTLHLRDDKVVGALGALVAQLDVSTFSLPALDEPRPCGAGVTTTCLQTADRSQWDRLYAGTLGIIDQISVLAVRDGAFNPLKRL